MARAKWGRDVCLDCRLEPVGYCATCTLARVAHAKKRQEARKAYMCEYIPWYRRGSAYAAQQASEKVREGQRRRQCEYREWQKKAGDGGQ